MKKVEIKICVNLKTIKRAYALLDLDIPSDEEIENKMSNLVIDLSGEAMQEAELGMAVLALNETF